MVRRGFDSLSPVLLCSTGSDRVTGECNVCVCVFVNVCVHVCMCACMYTKVHCTSHTLGSFYTYKQQRALPPVEEGGTKTPLRNVYLNPCFLTTDSDTECGVCMYLCVCVCVFALCIRVSHVPYGTAPTLPFILSPSLFLSTRCKDILPGAMGEDLAALAWGSGTLSGPGRWSPPPPPVQHCKGSAVCMYVCSMYMGAHVYLLVYSI